ncbi:MAG: hypothetical protein ROZ64_18285 [Burkholderiaceae bacterium]|nr:hypothetical protein [Burkholderiaceae bacterium]
MTQVQRWLRKSEVRTRYSANDRQIAELQAIGLPAPTYFGPRSPRWSISALDEFDRRVEAGEVVLVDRDKAAEQTAAARAMYMQRVASGEVRASRQATAARKRAEREGEHAAG